MEPIRWGLATLALAMAAIVLGLHLFVESGCRAVAIGDRGGRGMQENGSFGASVSGTARLMSAAALGVFAGAMLTEGGVLVPYWQSLPPADFFVWYAANDQRLLDFFGPVTTAMALLSLLAAIVSIGEGHPARLWTTAAAVLALAAVGSFFVYFEAANASFSAASIAPADLAAELSRWAAWHDARTVAALLALGCAMMALRPIRHTR